jgi:hypothetical protein
MDKFLEAYDQPKLNQENINWLNVSTTSNKIEASIESPQKTKGQDLMNSLLNSTRTLKKNEYQHSQTFPGNRKGRNTAKLILWNQYYNHPQTAQGHSKKRELQANLFNEHTSKNPQ